MQESVFSKIIKGDIPGHIIYQDDRVVALLDINPLSDGHVLVIPRQQVDVLWDLPTETYHHLWTTARHIAKIIQTQLQPQRVGVVVEGFDVPHAHIHLVPLYDRSVLQLHHGYPVDSSSANMSDIANRLAKALSIKSVT